MSEDRRTARRYVLWLPVQIESGSDRMLAVSRNVSFGGALVIAGASLEIGSAIELRLQFPGSAEDRVLGGEIVRVEENEEDPDGLWRYRLAVRFDEPVPELEAELERLESKTR